MKKYPVVENNSPYQELSADADHIDIKVAESTKTMREFMASFVSYMPAWMRALYAIRWGFVRLLGMKQEGIPQQVDVKAEDIPMEKGAKAGFFKVISAESASHYFSGATESHLAAYLGLVCEPMAGDLTRYYVITIVHYHNWTGPVYFNVIRLFHHLVVDQMIKHAERQPTVAVVMN